jgi:hypothetical protein
MTLSVSYPADLEVRSDRTQIDRAFFNRRFRALYDELARLDAGFEHFGATENTLVQLGLERLDDSLNPLLITLRAAADLGFLWGKSIGTPLSMVLGEAKGFVVTENQAVFVPTPVLFVQDITDTSNWGLVSLDVDGWHSTTGDLATHCIYASKTKSSTEWFISASAAIFPAMQDLLAQCTTARDATAASAAQVNSQMATLQSAINAIQSGPVASVAGRTGVVTLTENDIAGLVNDLAAKATIAYVNSQVLGKQNASAKLDTLINLAWQANQIIYATGAGTLSTLAVSDYLKTLLDDVDATTALSTLGVSTFAKTILDDPDAATARATLGIAAAPDVPVKASGAEIAIGTDDLKFATALGIAGTYLPKIAGINNQSGTSYTLVTADNSKIVRFTGGAAATCLLPASAVVGFNALVEQFGSGQVTVNVVTNATRRAFNSKFKLAGQNAVASVFCEANSDGAHAEWNVSGNLVL